MTSVEGMEHDTGNGTRLVILLNDGVKMTRGKAAAQAVHAALIALGAHPGCPVIVLGAKTAEIEACPVRVHDAGWTELPAGTLTAGVREIPASAGSLPELQPQLQPAGDWHLVSTNWDPNSGGWKARCSCKRYSSGAYPLPSQAMRCGLAHSVNMELAAVIRPPFS